MICACDLSIPLLRVVSIPARAMLFLFRMLSAMELAVLCRDVLATILVATLASHTNPLAWDTVNLSNQLVRTRHSFLSFLTRTKIHLKFFSYISTDYRNTTPKTPLCPGVNMAERLQAFEIWLTSRTVKKATCKQNLTKLS